MASIVNGLTTISSQAARAQINASKTTGSIANAIIDPGGALLKVAEAISKNKSNYSGFGGGIGGEQNITESDIDDIIGLPPSIYYEPDIASSVVLNTMPIASLNPAWPKFGGMTDNKVGLQLYEADTNKGQSKYQMIIKSAGSFNSKVPVRVAFLNDVSITESWSSEYSESSFEGMMNSGSEMLQEARYVTGGDNIAQGLGTIKDTFNNMSQGGGLSGGVSSVLGGITGGLEKAAGVLQDLGGTVGGVSAVQLASGSKVDFPMVWKGSNYSPSYAMTVRLYNPVPGSKSAYSKFIIEPLVKLIAFMVPLSDSAYTYSFPLLCELNAPGIMCLQAGYVASLDVIKGGENNDISFSQHCGMVDIRLTFGSLYNTMIAQVSDNGQKTQRPTLKKYVDCLLGITKKPKFYSIPTSEQTQHISTSQNIPSIYSSGVSGSSDKTSINTRVSNIQQNTANTLKNTDSVAIQNSNEQPTIEVNRLSSSTSNSVNGLNNIISTLGSEIKKQGYKFITTAGTLV